MIAAVTGYEVGLFVHIAAVFLAFGPTFAYAFFQAVIEQSNPRGTPAMWRSAERCTNYLVTPAAIVALAAGLYLTIDAWDFSDLFVNVGLLAIVLLLGLAHGFFNPQGRRAIEIAERDIEAAGAGDVALSDEYLAISKRVARVGALTGLVILATIYFMVVKP